MQQLYSNPPPLAEEKDALARNATTTSSEDSVIKNKNKNGLHVFTINLDANQDGHGVPPWSMVAIVMATFIAFFVIKKLWQCCLKHHPWA